MQQKGQGALEYLLLIGGAVLIAVIVIAVITGLANQTAPGVNNAAVCASHAGCESCKLAATSQCAGYTAAGVRQFISVGAAGATCTAAEATNFATCRSA